MTDKSDTDKAMEEMLGGASSDDQAGTETKTDESKSTEAKASETTEETKTETDNSAEDDWKAKARLWESRSKENKDKADKYDESVTRISELEGNLADANKKAGSAEAEVLRWKVAAKHGLTAEDVELFLNGSDEETLNKQAERLSTTSARSPRPDAHQGNRDVSGAMSPSQQGAADLAGLFD